MKQKSLAVSAAALAVVALAGCNKSSTDAIKPPQNQQQQSSSAPTSMTDTSSSSSDTSSSDTSSSDTSSSDSSSSSDTSSSSASGAAGALDQMVPSTPEQDQKFLTKGLAVTGRPASSLSPSQRKAVISGGKGVCVAFKAGQGYDAIAAKIQEGAGGRAPADKVKSIVRAATETYCPDQSSKVG